MMTCLGLWRRGQSAIDFIILPELINADNVWGIRTFHFRIVVQSFPIGLEIVRQIIERKFFRPGCSRLPDDGRKSFRRIRCRDALKASRWIRYLEIQKIVGKISALILV